MTSINSTSSASGYWQSIRDNWSSAVEEIEEDAVALGDAIGSAYDSVEDVVSSAAENVSTAVGTGVSEVKEAWETLGNAIDTLV